MLLFVSPCSYPDEQEPSILDPSDELLDALKAVARGSGTAKGNLSDMMISSAKAEPMTVPETPEASAARREMRKDQLAQQRESEGTYITGILARHAENAMKLALIRAVSRNPVAPEIRLDDVNWGKALSQHCIDTLLRDASRNVAENQFEREMNKAADIIRKYGPITLREMMRRGFKLPARERQEIIDTLLTAGIIQIAPSNQDGVGRPSVRYIALD
jgi:hypothetical protein